MSSKYFGYYNMVEALALEIDIDCVDNGINTNLVVGVDSKSLINWLLNFAKLP